MKCVSYWRARDSGKGCGAPERKQAKQQQDAYREGVVRDLVAMGAKEDDVFNLLAYSVCACPRSRLVQKPISLLRLKRDSPIRRKMLDFIFNYIVSGKRVTMIELSKGDFSRRDWKDADYLLHYGSLPTGGCFKKSVYNN